MSCKWNKKGKYDFIWVRNEKATNKGILNDLQKKVHTFTLEQRLQFTKRVHPYTSNYLSSTDRNLHDFSAINSICRNSFDSYLARYIWTKHGL